MFQRLRRAAVGATIAFAMVGPSLALATQLMPPGQQQFLGPTGVPLAGGFVYMYTPNTTICKTTWQDSGQVTPNACPVVLDSSGSALIYGSGCYLQVVQDANHVGVYSQLTCEPGAAAGTGGPVVWGGTAGGLGLPNAIVLPNATAFSAADGQVVAFIPIATNTGPTTVAAGSQGPVSVVKDTTGGPVALAGGEIVFSGSGNVVYMEYSAGQNQFHLLNTAIASASGAGTPLCNIVGLKVTNGSSPNTIAAITAFGAVLRTNTGLLITRSTVNVTVNTTLGNVTSTAGGMDGESPGASAWLFLFIVDNGAAPAGLASLAAGNGGAPTLPSGYNYYCYAGAMRVDGAGNFLRTLQRGATAEYQVTATTNTAQYPAIQTGSHGSCAAGAFEAEALVSFIPPLATRIKTVLVTSNTSTAAVSPNNGTAGPVGGGGNTSANGALVPASTTLAQFSEFVLPAQTLYYCSNGASNAVHAVGWTDVVNAN